MYVRKFEGETLEETLKEIKAELGPDAIILKTVTNKGLKGAFKKKKIEITAAISEKNYTNKARVDNVLTDQQKGEFYSSRSSYISNMIDSHASTAEHDNATTVVKNDGYGKMAVNKQVNTVKDFGKKIKTGLDDFLSLGTTSNTKPLEEKSELPEEIDFQQDHITKVPEQNSETFDRFIADQEQTSSNTQYEKRIESLELQLFELSKNVQKLEKQEPTGLYQLRTTLKSLDIADKYVQEIIKKAVFEFSPTELEDTDHVFEFALKEMLSKVNTSLPLFSTVNEDDGPVITVLLSETASGQSCMSTKLAALKKDSVLIKNISDFSEVENKRSLASSVFGMDVKTVKTSAEIVSESRKAIESGRSVFVDYKDFRKEFNDTKKFIDGLKRSFGKVEVLISLSAIHTELYNKKVMSLYKSLSDGITISHLDLCLNFGAIYNLVEETEAMPFKFFGTGETVPDDLEGATGERILAGIFQFE